MLKLRSVSIAEDRVCVPESDDCISTLLINHTDTQIKVENLMGPFYFSKVNNQVFDCGGTILRRTYFANIISEDGSKISIPHPSEIVGCGITIDGKFYWIAYENYENGKLLAELFVFNSSGSKIFGKITGFETIVKFKYEKNEYSVYIPLTL